MDDLLQPQPCVFCGRDDTDVCGELRTNGNVSIHYFCALFSSGLGQLGEDNCSGLWGFVEADISKEVRRAHRLRCRFCSNVGASIGCCVKSCRMSFHFPCGIANGVLAQYFGTFRTYCSDHRPRQSVPSSPSKLCRMSPTCAVCLCDVDTLSPSDDVLLVPCCQHVLLHRDCLQRQAKYSGVHHFKCPLCNNKNDFQAEMLQYGIYIPDQDAAWEMENDAFVDQLERHSHCDVTDCRCPHGRAANHLDTCWEIMLCDSCGSQGTHLACSGLMTPMDDWNCEPCILIIRQMLSAADVKPWRSVKQDTTSLSASSLPPDQPPTDTGAAEYSEPYKPRRRRLSSYMTRYCDIAKAEHIPLWLKHLLNDDIHTGRNVGAKMAYLCPGGE